MNMVVVEGGSKAVRAYTKLMTHRIRWGEEEFGEGDSDSDRLGAVVNAVVLRSDMYGGARFGFDWLMMPQIPPSSLVARRFFSCARFFFSLVTSDRKLA